MRVLRLGFGCEPPTAEAIPIPIVETDASVHGPYTLIKSVLKGKINN